MRALRFYLAKTEGLCKDRQLFVSYRNRGEAFGFSCWEGNSVLLDKADHTVLNDEWQYAFFVQVIIGLRTSKKCQMITQENDPVKHESILL